jgi:hypothetical protein
MDQAVQVYASEAARGSAIGSATTEGMVSWLSDLNELQVATGTATWQDVSLVQSPNFVINGGFDVWQRGTSSTSSGVYLADRFLHAFAAGSATISRSTDVPSNEGFTYSLSLASTSATNPIIAQRTESANSVNIAGKTVTLSVWAKSTVGTGPLSWDTAYPTATDNWGSETLDASGTFAATMTVGTWTRYSATFTANALATRGYRVTVYRSVTSTSTTTLYTGMQLELGSVATPFRRNANSIQGELAACQRYYYRSTGPQVFSALTSGFASTTSSATMLFNLPVTMRTAPSAVEWATIQITDIISAGTPSNISISNTISSNNIAALVVTATALTVYRTYFLTNANNVAGYIGVTAEL